PCPSFPELAIVAHSARPPNIIPQLIVESPRRGSFGMEASLKSAIPTTDDAQLLQDTPSHSERPVPSRPSLLRAPVGFTAVSRSPPSAPRPPSLPLPPPLPPAFVRSSLSPPPSATRRTYSFAREQARIPTVPGGPINPPPRTNSCPPDADVMFQTRGVRSNLDEYNSASTFMMECPTSPTSSDSSQPSDIEEGHTPHIKTKAPENASSFDLATQLEMESRRLELVWQETEKLWKDKHGTTLARSHDMAFRRKIEGGVGIKDDSPIDKEWRDMWKNTNDDWTEFEARWRKEDTHRRTASRNEDSHFHTAHSDSWNAAIADDDKVMNAIFTHFEKEMEKRRQRAERKRLDEVEQAERKRREEESDIWRAITEHESESRRSSGQGLTKDYPVDQSWLHDGLLRPDIFRTRSSSVIVEPRTGFQRSRSDSIATIVDPLSADVSINPLPTTLGPPTVEPRVRRSPRPSLSPSTSTRDIAEEVAKLSREQAALARRIQELRAVAEASEGPKREKTKELKLKDGDKPRAKSQLARKHSDEGAIFKAMQERLRKSEQQTVAAAAAAVAPDLNRKPEPTVITPEPRQATTAATADEPSGGWVRFRSDKMSAEDLPSPTPPRVRTPGPSKTPARVRTPSPNSNSPVNTTNTSVPEINKRSGSPPLASRVYINPNQTRAHAEGVPVESPVRMEESARRRVDATVGANITAAVAETLDQAGGKKRAMEAEPRVQGEPRAAEEQLAREQRRGEEAQRREAAERQRKERARYEHQKRENEERKRLWVFDPFLVAWSSYESRWSALTVTSPNQSFGFRDIPWPLLHAPAGPESITLQAVDEFILYPLHSQDKSRKERLHNAMLQWDPDKFEVRWMARIEENERPQVKEAVRGVYMSLVQILNGADPSGNRVGSVIIPVPQEPEEVAVTIGGHMSVQDIVGHLAGCGCEDLTANLDPSTFSECPNSHGGFSDVYRGRLSTGAHVAVKALRISIENIENPKHLKRAARELYTWSNCKHPNVLQLLGLAVFRGRIGMVSPWMDHGTVPRYLDGNTAMDRCNLCVQICDGLAYLHETGIQKVHGDLKGANVLALADGTPVLTDFGNSTFLGRTLLFTETTREGSLTGRWAAPELLEGSGQPSKEADVYALGMTMLEVITGRVPYDGKGDFAVLKLVSKKKHPERPNEHIPTESRDGNKLWRLLKKCWAHDPEKRPSASRVAEI
ncbi:hypothetical protein FRC11_007426, partial [Ceratobasidium sp. 423]